MVVRIWRALTLMRVALTTGSSFAHTLQANEGAPNCY
jgi:hypothetical protein